MIEPLFPRLWSHQAFYHYTTDLDVQSLRKLYLLLHHALVRNPLIQGVVVIEQWWYIYRVGQKSLRYLEWL